MSESAGQSAPLPRRRVPKDPFAVAPAARPQPVPEPARPKPTARGPREDKPFRRAAEPERPAAVNPPSRALVRQAEPDEPRRRQRDEEEAEPPRRRRAADDAEFSAEPPRRRREPEEEPARERYAEDDEPARRPRRRGPDDDGEPRRRRAEEPEEREQPRSGRRPQREPESPTDKVIKPLMRLVGWVRTLLDVATVLYIAALIFLLVTLEWSAEDHAFTAALLYLPPVTFLAPLLVLAPMSLLFWRPWLLPFHLLCVAGVFGAFMRYGRNEHVQATGPTLTLVSNNIGEAHGRSLQPFVQREAPDIIALQDALGRGPEYRRTYTNHYLAGVGQFLLISRFPIRKAELVPLGTADKDAVAACFEVEFNGLPLAIYNVHLPTPRRHLEAVKGLGMLALLFGRSGGHGETVRTDSEAFWANQVKLASSLVEHIGKDKRQCLIAGDLNAPGRGVVFHRFADQFTDSFRTRGQGYGLNFPGDARTGPWLRLDHILSTVRFRPIYARVEEGRQSQHRAVVARFELQ